jgi:hypothetical protein
VIDVDDATEHAIAQHAPAAGATLAVLQRGVRASDAVAQHRQPQLDRLAADEGDHLRREEWQWKVGRSHRGFAQRRRVLVPAVRRPHAHHEQVCAATGAARGRESAELLVVGFKSWHSVHSVPGSRPPTSRRFSPALCAPGVWYRLSWSGSVGKRPCQTPYSSTELEASGQTRVTESATRRVGARTVRRATVRCKVRLAVAYGRRSTLWPRRQPRPPWTWRARRSRVEGEQNRNLVRDKIR